MKVAVCVSGVISKNYSESLKNLKEYFPYDFFHAAWSNKPKPNDICIFEFEEPKMHYHPGSNLDIHLPESFKRYPTHNDKFLHRTKQILIHSYLLRKIPLEYDMIIRCRFDNIIDKKQDHILALVKKSYETGEVIGIHCPKGNPEKYINNFQEYPSHSPKAKEYLVDHMIFHRRDSFDCDYVESLHNRKKLLPCEWGWYQALSEKNPAGHKSYLGFASIKKVLEYGYQ